MSSEVVPPGHHAYCVRQEAGTHPGFPESRLGFSGAVDGGFGTFLGVLGFVPLITGLVGWCPLYAIFRLRTSRETAEV